ncbi:MAG: universal stress protein [Casimicrobiaceae bacterium]
MYKRILLAYDGSECGQKALLDCQDIAQWSQSQLFLVAVMPLPAAYIAEGAILDSGHEEQARQQYRDVLDEGIRRLSQSGYTATGEVVVGESVNEITKYARRIEADLIVVGHKHLEGLAARWWRGSTSPALIERAHCSVLVVITH